MTRSISCRRRLSAVLVVLAVAASIGTGLDRSASKASVSAPMHLCPPAC